MAEESRNWSRDAEELAACFTVHARDLFGFACVLTDADQTVAGDLVQGAFEAASAVWCTLRDLPADECGAWLRDTLAAAAQRRTGHPAGRAFVSPSHRQRTELKMARFRADYDAVAGLDRFADWLRTRQDGALSGNADGDAPPGSAQAGLPETAGSGERPDGPSGIGRTTPPPAGTDGPAGSTPGHAGPDPATPGPGGPNPAGRASKPGARLAGWSAIRPATLSALPNGTPSNGANGLGAPTDRTNGNGALANGHGAPTYGSNGNGGAGSTHGNGAAAPPGSYGDPVSALYEQHYASLVRLAALLVRDTATAEQIVQDSFVAVAAAWRRRGDTGRSDTDGALAFLRQSVLDRSRSALRHGITPAPAATGRPTGSPPLLAALGELPARQREVLVLRYYANLSEEQAADTIGISPAAVRRHATRANAALRTLLDAG